jgi:hypothetical protein
MNEFASNWGLLAGSLLIASPVVWTKIRETVPLEDDLKFSDETVEEVAGRGASVGKGWGNEISHPEAVDEKKI